MKLQVEILAGRSALKMAMMATRGKGKFTIHKGLSPKSTRKAFLMMHGTLNRYIFHVLGYVPDRVHTHLRTHHLINEFYQCSTSRPDLEHATNGAMRWIDLLIPAKRLIEVAQLRLCEKTTWHETYEFYNELADKVVAIEPAVMDMLQPMCVHTGICRNGKCDMYPINMHRHEELKHEIESL